MMNRTAPFGRPAWVLLLLLSAALGPATAAPPAPGPCAGGWTGLRSADGSYTVWSDCSGNPAADLHFAAQMIDHVWVPMQSLMGSPVPDLGGSAGGGDPAIDFYLLPPGTPLTHGGRSLPALGAGELGSFHVAEPRPGKTCSGFLMLRRDKLKDPGFASNIAHEVFHLFQGAHNCKTRARAPGGKAAEEFWFSEASAKWAETHFVRATSGPIVHTPLFARIFQKGLHTPLSAGAPDFAPYAAYIWPFFMEQEKGANAIARVWKAMAGKTDWNGYMDAVDHELPFRDFFPEFALRNLNLDLGKALRPRYVELDAGFPDGVPPKLLVDGMLAGHAKTAPGRRISVSVPSLKAHYYRWKVGADVGKVELDFSKLGSQGDYDVQVLVKQDGEWDLYRLGAYGAMAPFCRPEEIYLVLSNPDRDPGRTVTGSFEVKSPSEECRGWNGWVTLRATDGASYQSEWARSEKAEWHVPVQNLTSSRNATGPMSVQYLYDGWGTCNSAAGGISVTRIRASGTVTAEIELADYGDGEYTIYVDSTEKVPEVETTTGCGGPSSTGYDADLWYVSMGPSFDVKVDPKEPDVLRGTTQRVFEGGEIDMIHGYEWNLRRESASP